MGRLIRLAALLALLLCLVASVAAAQSGAPKADADKSADSKHIPRFLLLISEQNIAGSPSAWWTGEGGIAGSVAAIELGLVENLFVETLRNSGYQVMDHQVLAGKIVVPQPLRILAPNNEKASEIAQLFGADYVIIGKAVATGGEGVEGSGILSATATVNVRVVNAKTAEIVANASQKASAMNASAVAAGQAALKKAGDQAASMLVRAMNSKPGIKAFVID